MAGTRGFPSNIILAFRPEGFSPRGFGLTELRAAKGGAQPFSTYALRAKQENF